MADKKVAMADDEKPHPATPNISPSFSPTMGLKSFSIEGIYDNPRTRTAAPGMTDEDRAWRRQWLKDQILDANEPHNVSGAYEEFFNPIRRFYRFPLDQLYQKLKPIMGKEQAYHVRWWIGRTSLCVALFYMGMYYLKYNKRDWTTVQGWRVLKSREMVLPGDPRYPMISTKSKGSDYYFDGFDKAEI